MATFAKSTGKAIILDTAQTKEFDLAIKNSNALAKILGRSAANLSKSGAGSKPLNIKDYLK